MRRVLSRILPTFQEGVKSKDLPSIANYPPLQLGRAWLPLSNRDLGALELQQKAV